MKSEKGILRFLLAVLCFFFPLLGLILYLLLREKDEETSRAAGIGALSGTVVGILLYFATIGLTIIFGLPVPK